MSKEHKITINKVKYITYIADVTKGKTPCTNCVFDKEPDTTKCELTRFVCINDRNIDSKDRKWKKVIVENKLRDPKTGRFIKTENNITISDLRYFTHLYQSFVKRIEKFANNFKI